MQTNPPVISSSENGVKPGLNTCAKVFVPKGKKTDGPQSTSDITSVTSMTEN